MRLNSYIKTGKKVLSILKEHGHNAYFVGGFVRDFLLDIKIHDIDITTSATPSEVESCFPKTKATGIKYGSVTVYMNQHSYEVTTFRSDLDYIDHRHPSSVSFSNKIEDDLIRRDFTMNALAMDEDGLITDLFDGKNDIINKKIKAIGNPDQRFFEDALRILRAFRFVSKLGFDIEKLTFQSIVKNHNWLNKISNERVIQELKKIIEYPYALKALKELNKAGVTDTLIELKEGIKFISKQIDFSLSILEFFALCFYLHEEEISDLWRFSNKEKSIINRIIELVTVTQNDSFNELILYSNGLDLCLFADHVNVVLNKDNQQTKRLLEMYQKMPIHKTCDLAFKGQDILELTTLKNAKIIGNIIDDLTYQVITLQIRNDYHELKEYTLAHYIPKKAMRL